MAFCAKCGCEKPSLPRPLPPRTSAEIAFGQIVEGTLSARFAFHPARWITGAPESNRASTRYAMPSFQKTAIIWARLRRSAISYYWASGRRQQAPQRLRAIKIPDLSRAVTGMRHPTVWSLSPSTAGAFPAMTHQDDPDCWMLNFPLTFEGGKALPAALVVHGQAQN